MKRLLFPFAGTLSLCLSSCFSPADGLAGAEELDPEAVRVTFNIGSIEQISFGDADTRASLHDLCSRITFAIFKDGSKVKNINQLSDAEGFGSFAVSLSPGTYQLVMIAHNGLGNCSVSSPEQITFANNKCTDTFYAYDTVEVSEPTTQIIDLHRAVAMFRLITTDAIPASVSKMQFYYTGGSSTFDAVTGLGCKNSRQTEVFQVASMAGQTGQFEVYTFPHSETDELKMTVTALDGTDGEVAQYEYPNLPVTINKITQSTVEFFSGGGASSSDFTISIPSGGQWAETIEI